MLPKAACARRQTCLLSPAPQSSNRATPHLRLLAVEWTRDGCCGGQVLCCCRCVSVGSAQLFKSAVVKLAAFKVECREKIVQSWGDVWRMSGARRGWLIVPV